MEIADKYVSEYWTLFAGLADFSMTHYDFFWNSKGDVGLLGSFPQEKTKPEKLKTSKTNLLSIQRNANVPLGIFLCGNFWSRSL